MVVNTMDDMVRNRKLTVARGFIVGSRNWTGSRRGEDWGDEGKGGDESGELELHD